MNQNNRNYRATFILDNRGQEESIDKLIEGVKQEIAAVSGQVTAVENLGRRDFARVTNPKLAAGTYVQVDFSAPGTTPAQLRERLRLNHSVYRTFVQAR
jgi:small subunit ribosomal protein S6